MQTQENNTTEETTSTVENTEQPQLSVEEQMEELNKISKARHKMMSMAVRGYVSDYLNTLAFKPGINGAKKAEMIVNFTDMLEGALDLGLEVTKAKIPSKGVVGKKVLPMGELLVQAMDNRMLLLAQNMEQAEQNNTTTEEVVAEGIENGSGQ